MISLQLQNEWCGDDTPPDYESSPNRGKAMGKGDEINVAGRAQGGPENSQSRTSGQCTFCGCATREDVIEAAFWTDTGLVVVEGIPVRRCDGCGELFFEEEVARRVQEALSCSGGESERQVQVSVYSMPVVRAERTGCDRRIRDRARTGHEVEQVFATAEVDQADDKVFACQYCGSETAEHVTRSAFWIDGRWMAVENIPARVCQCCKEQFYDDETVERIAAIREGRDIPGLARMEVRVPVLSYAHVTGMHYQEPL